MVFLAGKSPTIRSHTECLYTVLANPINAFHTLSEKTNRCVECMPAKQGNRSASAYTTDQHQPWRVCVCA